MIDSSDNASKKDARSKAVLLGIGLDNKDKHIRVTRGPNFHLMGGSEDTHAHMQRTAIRLNEKLKKRGKALDDVDRTEFRDLVHESME